MNVMHWLWIPRLIIHLSLIVSTAVIGATTTTVVSTQYPQQPVVQGGQYPPYQPMPSQAGYGGTPAYGGQPMPTGPYQGQPYIAGPPPPYQEAGKIIQPCTTKFSKLGNIYKNSWWFCCKCCECWNYLLGNRVSLSHDLWVMSMTVLRPILWIQNISVHQFTVIHLRCHWKKLVCGTFDLINGWSIVISLFNVSSCVMLLFEHKQYLQSWKFNANRDIIFCDITNPYIYINPAPRNTQQRGRGHVTLL